MEYLLKHSPIKIQEFLTESTYATPEKTSNTISPSALRGYVLRHKSQAGFNFGLEPTLLLVHEL